MVLFTLTVPYEIHLRGMKSLQVKCCIQLKLNYFLTEKEVKNDVLTGTR